VKRPENTPARMRSEGLPLIPAVLTVAVVTAWALSGGGYESQPVLGGEYDPNPWYLGALALIGLWGATALGLVRVRMSRWPAIACAALAAYTAWSFLSILWAHDQGAALHGSDRTLVYLAAFTTFAMLPWTRWSLRVALTLLVAGLGAVAVVSAIRLAVLSDPSGLYLDARLVYPLGYYNADAALFTMAALVAIALACQRGGAPVLRVAGLTIAAVCLQLAVLGQSRGWLFTAPLVLALTLLILPGRLRLLAFALGPAAATAVATPALLGVYGHATVNGVALPEPRIAHVLHQQGAHAVRVMLLADVVLALLAALAVVLDRRTALSTDATRRANRLGAALAALAVLAALAIGLVATHGHPIGRVERAWNSFAATGAGSGTGGSSRFGGLGSQRADFWRVALDEWSAHPLLGIGQDNFAAGYLRLRHTEQEPRWVHSWELRLLAHTGLIGALMFALFLIAAGLAALRGPGVRAPPERAAAAIALLPAIIWLVHGSIDWFWEMPALSVPSLAFAGAAAALGGAQARNERATALPDETPSAAGTRGRARTPAIVLRCVAALLGLGALVALAIPYAAARETQKAIAIWPTRPALAYSELRSASSLLPFDPQTYLVGGAIALDLEEPATARGFFAQADNRDDQEWLGPFVIGLLDAEQGLRTQARAQLLRARTLNPRESLITQALVRLTGRSTLTVAEAQYDLSLRSEARFGH
jgi:O-Antigen ligase